MSELHLRGPPRPRWRSLTTCPPQTLAAETPAPSCITEGLLLGEKEQPGIAAQTSAKAEATRQSLSDPFPFQEKDHEKHRAAQAA